MARVTTNEPPTRAFRMIGMKQQRREALAARDVLLAKPLVTVFFDVAEFGQLRQYFGRVL